MTIREVQEKIKVDIFDLKNEILKRDSKIRKYGDFLDFDLMGNSYRLRFEFNKNWVATLDWVQEVKQFEYHYTELLKIELNANIDDIELSDNFFEKIFEKLSIKGV